MPNPPMDNALDDTKQKLLKLLEDFSQLGILVHDFQGPEITKAPLKNALNITIKDLKKLQTPSKELDNIPIPLDVLQYIEDGRNPDVYTREFVEATRKSNQYLRGKMDAFKELRDTLSKKVINEFPELEEVVKDIKHRTDG